MSKKNRIDQEAKMKREEIDMPMTTEVTGKLVPMSLELFKALKGKKDETIIRAVSNHEELLKMLKSSLEGWNQLLTLNYTSSVKLEPQTVTTIRAEVKLIEAVIEKAEGR